MSKAEVDAIPAAKVYHIKINGHWRCATVDKSSSTSVPYELTVPVNSSTYYSCSACEAGCS